jgi:hypothetical protein
VATFKQWTLTGNMVLTSGDTENDEHGEQINHTLKFYGLRNGRGTFILKIERKIIIISRRKLKQKCIRGIQIADELNSSSNNYVICDPLSTDEDSALFNQQRLSEALGPFVLSHLTLNN